MSETNSGESHPASVVEDDRTGVSIEALKRAFIDNLFYHRGRHYAGASRNDFYLALPTRSATGWRPAGLTPFSML